MQAVIKEARQTLLLAVPIVIGQVGLMLMGVTDSVMIGRVGTVPLAASSFGGGVFNIFFIVGVGLLAPVAIFASRARGAGRHDEAGEYLRHGLFLSFVSGLAEIGLILYLGMHLEWFRQKPEVLAAVNPFFLLIGFSLVPVLAYLALRQFAESMGRPWVPVLVILSGVLLNILLNWVFIYGHLGAPRLGLTGAGISTLISRTLGSLVIFAWLRLDPGMRAGVEAKPREVDQGTQRAGVSVEMPAPVGPGGRPEVPVNEHPVQEDVEQDPGEDDQDRDQGLPIDSANCRRAR